jgi:hypothetical protein
MAFIICTGSPQLMFPTQLEQMQWYQSFQSLKMRNQDPLSRSEYLFRVISYRLNYCI